MNVSGSMTSQQACGCLVDAERYQDKDEDVVITQRVDYACGCRSIQHEYHDGSMSRTIVRHDGSVLVDELLSAE